MASKAERQRRILELVERNLIDSQDQLQDLLLAEDLACSQTTLSRDLRELGLLKDSRRGYRVPAGSAAAPDALARLAHDIAPRLVSADAGGSVAVLRTATGAALVATAVDGARLPAVVAAVPCGDIVLVVMRSPADARHLAAALRDRRSR
jgi:transcriptional regulator of arginine metabolism